MARSVEEFYGELAPPLPIGVLPAEDDASGGPATGAETTGAHAPA